MGEARRRGTRAQRRARPKHDKPGDFWRERERKLAAAAERKELEEIRARNRMDRLIRSPDGVAR